MAKKKKKKVQESPEKEDLQDEEGLEEEASGDEADEPVKGKGFFGRILQGIWERKWISFSAVSLASMFIGLGMHGGLQFIAKEKEKIPKISEEKILRDNLQEEELPPFYIPMPSDASEQVVMIDFSVIWDGLASVRFKKMELQIRNHLYGYLQKLAERRKDIKEKAPFLEAEMSRIFRETLGIPDVVVKIKAIKTY